MKQFVEVAVNVANIDRTYHYAVPEALQSQVQPGNLVEVSFNNRMVQGVVLGFVDEPEVATVFDILSLHEENTLLTQNQLDLASWLAKATNKMKPA